MTEAEVDFLLERYDQTEPGLQRKIVARFVDKCERYRQALEGVISQLDKWAAESFSGSWSIHQVDPMLKKADELRRLLSNDCHKRQQD